MRWIGLTARLDSERSGLRSSTGLVAKQQPKTCASRFGNNPSERGTSQIRPGEEGRSRGAAPRDNALYIHRNQLTGTMRTRGKQTKKKGPGTRGSTQCQREWYQVLTSAALGIPSNEERLACNGARPGGELNISTGPLETDMSLRGVYDYRVNGRHNGGQDGGDREQLHGCVVRRKVRRGGG